MSATTRIGVVGYGTGGQHFHTPYVAAAPGVELAGVVARAPETVAKVQRDWPGVPVHGSLAEMIEAGVDAVTITTPPATRRGLVLEAVAAGVPVVADKPFAPTARDAQDLVDAAERAGVLLTVFHNRRWDADVRTLQGLLERRAFGEPWRLHSRFDADDPGTLEGGPHGGLLRDIGSHLVDQAQHLLGPARTVTAHLDDAVTDEGPTDASFVLHLEHEGGAVSVLESTKLNHLQCRELRCYGSAGSYRQLGTDVQATAIFAGRRPTQDPAAWGYEPEHAWGLLATDAGTVAVPSAQGSYTEFYRHWGAAVRGEGPVPVDPRDGVRVLAVLDAARESAALGATVAVRVPAPASV
ncbi:Gfo/Idh/MocA family protein [Nocardioides bruguierae]|uniref:Gfo/Idh/MocA family protein n=1 Tax=Nocardioides bruguierae TaxID=2945102 RepID=UPI002021D7C8|nr:Gfo/Idh/MocA family oxidoreductase [Nocardioides bruguierae]MCL8024477.1 Gfo/Idh/MocA family oxidoreductase [Nocardioides bruguierae]